ncbi:hypothetical protein, partial [Klebsiella quasipneumoniae]|uniref:hypothetical protein n=1 Tax=Klebsiella quasipneumoniae TaxID=1463165 RepID=UPI003B42D814
AENTDDLFVGKSLLHGDVLMWLMKTLLTSRCINQRGAGQQNQALASVDQQRQQEQQERQTQSLNDVLKGPVQTNCTRYGNSVYCTSY